MKLMRVGPAGKERAVMLDAQGQVRDLSALLADFETRHLLPAGINALSAIDATQLPLMAEDLRIGCPIAHVGKIVCVGLNYAAHAKESGMEPPKEPVIFLKATNSLSGPNDDVWIPEGSVKTDWEVELGVVIGKPARYVSEARAMDHVAGYVVINDISEREYQLERGGQWDKGKGCDTFSPIGPWLATPDEIPNPHNLRLWLEVNGCKVQDSSTSDLIFNIPHLISYLSRFMSLQTGDIISTGTPQGVGLGQKPVPWYLKAGDVMRVGIEGLGEQIQKCVPTQIPAEA